MHNGARPQSTSKELDLVFGKLIWFLRTDPAASGAVCQWKWIQVMTLRLCSDVAEEWSYVLFADRWGNPCCCRRGNLQQKSSSKTAVIARNFDSYFCSIFGLSKLSTALTAQGLTHKLTGLWQDAYKIQTKINQSKAQKDENWHGGTVLYKRITQHISFDDFFLKLL